MRHTYSAGGIVVNRQSGEVLVVNQDGTSWSLPKGKIEAGEDALAAAAREIQEESGITEVEFIKELGSYDRYKINKNGQGEDLAELKTITMHLYVTRQHELQPSDPSNPEARWVAPGEVSALLTHPKDKAFYQSHMAEIAALQI